MHIARLRRKIEPDPKVPRFILTVPKAGYKLVVTRINYLRKTAALFNEFRETGVSSKLKFNSATDLRANYPQFFWQMVQPYIVDALRYLRVTQEGQQWVSNLYANVFLMEHWGKDSTTRSIGTGAPSR
jgi:Transcriptional regulatory protein, C terminal